MEIDLANDGTIDQTVIPDSVSTTVDQPQNNISIPAYDGTGTINITASSGNITNAGNMNVTMFPQKEFYEFPDGLIAVTIPGLNNGSTVNLTITLPESLSVDAQFWEYGKTADNNTSRWYQIPLGSNNGDNVITVELKDGGFGDDDGIENGVIMTTGGPGIYTRQGISGFVIDSINKTGIAGVTVSINGGNSTVADQFGFYSLSVAEGLYNLKAKYDPTYYLNNTITVSMVGKEVVVQTIELTKKPNGNIKGGVTKK